MNLEEYKYNGFKMFNRHEFRQIYGKPREDVTYRILAQYKDGVVFKRWIERNDEWIPYIVRMDSMFSEHDEFIENLTEEDVFTFLL